MLRIVIAEDAVLLRAGLVELLERVGHRVPAAVGDAAALIRAVDAERPDVVVTDVRMPPGHRDEGLRAALELRGRHPGLPVLVLSQYVATAYATRLLGEGSADRGGLGYLLKDRVLEVTDFTDALERVAAGRTVIDPEVVRILLARHTAADPLRRLTPREREVLGLMAEGWNNQAVAQRLGVTEASVVKHAGNIFMKLDLDPEEGNRRVLAVLAYHNRANEEVN
ncbi:MULTISPECIES: response regulator transcription factor [Kitasatospora]|uniref:Putative two-component system response regulator n=1 Tax=Kitasatospora setae (strain ATCC 33774 / DSM 43861 / JCM 3304 / KCC A-0304 / NBRC 14216 / KM-6054) TaxID=452652 RepID=E4N124_KITSK|nr:response regulator transcription factor [Kitasatospora setae]BAJ31858.1 putative two-component system response regulator [Kitasatospora setae KM-6054]